MTCRILICAAALLTLPTAAVAGTAAPSVADPAGAACIAALTAEATPLPAPAPKKKKGLGFLKSLTSVAPFIPGVGMAGMVGSALVSSVAEHVSQTRGSETVARKTGQQLSETAKQRC